MNPSANGSIRLMNTLRNQIRLPLPSFHSDESEQDQVILQVQPKRSTLSPSKKLSSTLDFFQIHELMKLEISSGMRLIQGSRVIFGEVNGSLISNLSQSNFEIVLLSDSIVVSDQNLTSTSNTLYELSIVAFNPSTLVLNLPNLNLKLSSLPPPAFLDILSLSSAKFPLLPNSLPTPSIPLPRWSSSNLTLCEVSDCKSPKFTTLNRRHHCRRSDCGKLICRACSRWKEFEGESGDGKVRVCKVCFERER